VRRIFASLDTRENLYGLKKKDKTIQAMFRHPRNTQRSFERNSPFE
jgi:hypothetical protein